MGLARPREVGIIMYSCLFIEAKQKMKLNPHLMGMHAPFELYISF